MSPDEDALLNGIAADPAADLPRLVYADWLEERGQDLRAEFIRIQCEIAKLEVGPRDVIDRNVHLWRRQQELLDGHMGELLEGVPLTPRPGQVPGPRFYRGFVDEIELNDEELSKRGEAILTVRPFPGRIALVSETRLGSLHSHFESLTYSHDFDVGRLMTSLHLLPSASEGVVSRSSIPDADQPERRVVWQRLTSLISTHDFLSPLTIPFLRDDMPALRVLVLANHGIDDYEVINLLNAGILQRLSHISLIENAIGDQSAIEMADRLGNSPNLKELDLRRNGITTVGQAALLARLGSKVILF